jgi:lipopolysaccharide export system protein LptC
MSGSAETLRHRRRADAAPGGPHDRKVRFLFSALPIGVGMIGAVMIITPMFPRGEVSFLLDRNKVAMAKERLAVSQAHYRGQDSQGRAFSLTAGQAVQHSASVPVVVMQDLVAQMQMQDGPSAVSATSGRYDINRERMDLSGPVQFKGADGYSMVTSSVALDLKSRRAFGTGGVSGTVPAGTFSADRISADLPERRVVLEGHARLRMAGGHMVIPR